MAATVSVASTLAFVTLVPSHARDQEAKEGAKEAQKAAKQQQKAQPAAGAAPAAAPSTAAVPPQLSPSASVSSSSSTEAAQPERKGFNVGQFCKVCGFVCWSCGGSSACSAISCMQAERTMHWSIGDCTKNATLFCPTPTGCVVNGH